MRVFQNWKKDGDSSLGLLSDLHIWSLALNGPLRRREDLGIKLFNLVQERGMGYLQIESLKKIGFRSHEARRLLGMMELHRRLCRFSNHLDQISSPDDAYKLFAPFLNLSNREEFFIAVLDIQNKVRRIELLASGSEMACAVDICQLLRCALLFDGRSILMAHNHPSGCVEPSAFDLNLTQKVQMLCADIQMTLLDHIIVGREGLIPEYFSFAQEGILLP